VVLLSGGLDSAVLLAVEAAAGNEPMCLSFDYGQRHADRELAAAGAVAEYYGAERVVIGLPPDVFRGSALTGGGPVPHGHYADPAQAATVVPNRNMVLVACAAAYARSAGRGLVGVAAHKGDAAVYPDCRPEFFDALGAALRFGCGVRLHAPFLSLTKREVVAIGRDLSVPFRLTWSCYEGGEAPCGLCGACVERAEALA